MSPSPSPGWPGASAAPPAGLSSAVLPAAFPALHSDSDGHCSDRSAGHSGGDLSSTDILNKFVIVDGVDYKSNSNIRKLLYMEV